MSVDKIAGWLDGSENEDHDFSIFFGEDQIDMMTAFLQEGISDISPYVNSDKTVNGDPVNGGKLWEASCQHCHGKEGLEINFGSAEKPEFIGTVASGNPWEFFHKATFGQPGEHMPSGRSLGFSPQDRTDIISFTRDMPTTK